MKKNFVKIILSFICILCFVSSNIVFALPTASSSSPELHSNGIIDKATAKSNFGPLPLQFKEVVAVTGDSYAGIFCQFEDMKNFKLMEYAIAGRTIIENEDLMIQAAIAPGKILIISIGVNDHVRNTPPYKFEATLRRILNYALLTEKIVFVHSYVDYPISHNVPSQYDISQYDETLKRLTNSFKNLHYVDMHGYDTSEYILSDNIHYGKDFYDIMYNKIINILMTIDF